MSETVTNAEVEDVLSSIRRLVSEDRKPAQKPSEAPAIEEKLVLTPSLRVSNDAPVAAPRKEATPEAVQPRSASYQDAMQDMEGLHDPAQQSIHAGVHLFMAVIPQPGVIMIAHDFGPYAQEVASILPASLLIPLSAPARQQKHGHRL